MNGRFEKLYSLPSQLYAPSSPVIITAGALLKDTQTGKVLAQLKFKNINSKVIKAITVSLLPHDTANQPLGEKETHQILDLAANRDSEFGQKTPLYFSNNTTRAYQVIVEEVVFSDNTVWKTDGTPLSELPAQKAASETLVDAELEKQYKSEYGERANFMADTCFDLWRCHCGAINNNNEFNCHICDIEKNYVLAFDIERLRDNCNTRLERAEREKQEALAVSKKRLTKVSIIAAMLLVGIVLIRAYISFIVPSIDYKKATDAYSTGNYLTAIAAYEKLGSFKNSKEMLQKSFSSYADLLFDEGDYQSAIEYYGKLAEKNPEKEKECHYHLMLAAIDANDWEQADEEYSLIKGYSDADNRAVDITVGKVKELVEKKYYLAANRLLNSCSSKDEKILTLKRDVQYLLSLSYFEGNNGQSQDYIKAANGFSELIGDEKYGAEAKEFLYLCAVQIYEKSSSKDKALMYFEKISEYKNSKTYLEKQNRVSGKIASSKKEASLSLTTEASSEYIPKLSWYIADHVHDETISIDGLRGPNGEYRSKELFSHIEVYKDGQPVSGPGTSEGYKIVCQSSAPEIVSCEVGGYYASEYWNTITGTPHQEGTATVTLYLYQIVSGEMSLVDTWSWYLTIIQ